MTALRLNPSTEPRLVDPRHEVGWPSRRRVVDVGDPAATAAIVNLTVLGSTVGGFGTAWADGTPKPASSCINFGVGDIIANCILVATTGGRFVVELNTPAHLLVDLVGVITP